MHHPLDGARLKIIRAKEHCDVLKAEIGMYLNQQSHDIYSQPDISHYANPRTMQYAAYYVAMGRPTHVLPKVEPPHPPPLRLSTLVGDCVTNARAALDYIVWELIQKFWDPIYRNRGRDRFIAHFPINVGGTAYRDNLDALTQRMTRANPAGVDVPTLAKDAIQSSQTNGRRDDVLGWLHRIVNDDKHKAPILTAVEITGAVVEFGQSPLHFDANVTPPRMTVPRQSITSGPLLRSDVQMKAQPTFTVAFEDVTMPREPVDWTLEQIIEAAADVIPRFDRFF